MMWVRRVDVRKRHTICCVMCKPSCVTFLWHFTLPLKSPSQFTWGVMVRISDIFWQDVLFPRLFFLLHSLACSIATWMFGAWVMSINVNDYNHWQTYVFLLLTCLYVDKHDCWFISQGKLPSRSWEITE